jgi:uncharacterized protein (UPF0335 family)
MELAQQLMHHYVCYYDNVSEIPNWISNIFCSAVTGGSFAKRELYTNDDDIIFNIKDMSLAFNGINLAATNADLLDRGIIFELERILEENMSIKSDILEKLENMKPQLLGYIFDILVKVLQLKRKRKRKRRKNLVN